MWGHGAAEPWEPRGTSLVSVACVILNALEINTECCEYGAENEIKRFPGI